VSMDTRLRDLQHQAFTRMLLEQYGPVWGRLLAFGMIPAWQGAKAVAQHTGAPGRWASQQLPVGMQPHRGTPPSWEQLRTGWAPIFQAQTRYLPDRGGRK